MAVLDDLWHLTIEKCENQGSDMGPIHIRIRHDNDFMIAKFLNLKITFADSRPQGGNNRLDFLIGKHFIKAGLFHIEDLPLEGKDSLRPLLPPLFRGSPRRISLHEVEFRLNWILCLAVRKLSWKRSRVKGPLPSRQLPRPPRRIPGTGRSNHLLNNLFGNRGILLPVGAQVLVDKTLYIPLHLAVTQFCLCLSLELGFWNLDTHHPNKALSHIIP